MLKVSSKKKLFLEVLFFARKKGFKLAMKRAQFKAVRIKINILSPLFSVKEELKVRLSDLNLFRYIIIPFSLTAHNTQGLHSKSDGEYGETRS